MNRAKQIWREVFRSSEGWWLTPKWFRFWYRAGGWTAVRNAWRWATGKNGLKRNT